MKEHRDLAESVLNYWNNNQNKRNDNAKHDAINLIEIKKSINEAIKSIKLIHKKRPKIVATDARIMQNMVN